jgi:hypothetical protein
MASHLVTIQGVIETPYYDWGTRKYIEIRTDDGVVYRAKVPFRYGRVMCNVTGLKTIQELEKGERVRGMIERKTWDGETHHVIISLGQA